MRNRSGFTLVELSIVLVILGLLVGGVLAGQSLIRSAELRAITTEFSAYKSALGAFREKYNALPGDMPNAVRFWGAADGATTDGYDADCDAVSTAATGTETCNGNGDGRSGDFGNVLTEYEMWRAWQHLGNAGIVEGSFAGVELSTSQVLGASIPKSRFNGGGWGFNWLSPYNGDAEYFDGSYGNQLTFMSSDFGPVIAPDEAYAVDAKMDDGKPGTGFIRVNKDQGTGDCVTADDTNYLVSKTSIGCYFFMNSGH